MMSVKNIIFDLGGVLIPLDMKAISDSFKRLGARNFDETYSQFKQVSLFDDFDNGSVTEEEFRIELKKFLKDDITDAEINEAWNSMLGIIPVEKIELLKKLKKNYRLFLLSNTDCIHVKKFEADHEAYYGENIFKKIFEKTYYSCNIGMRKPGKEIFELVIRENNLNVTETIFIDDTMQHVKGAKAAYLLAYHLDLENDSLEPLIEKVLRSDEVTK